MRFRHTLAAVQLLCFTNVGFAADVQVTPELVRQLQFMLLTVGIDPGPLDGNPQTKTNNAIRTFESSVGLPPSNVKMGGQVSQELLDKLREATLTKLDRKLEAPAPPNKGETALPAPKAPEQVVAAPALPQMPPPPSDRFASCRFDPKDFDIGGKQFTPQTFLEVGFNGSTDIAVENLRKRLTEARRIAEQNRGAALVEVQRQARVLEYFECRQKVEKG